MVTIDVVYVNSIRFRFLGVNDRGLNLNFSQIKITTYIDGDIESNPGPTQNDFKSSVGHPKKIKVFKETAKKVILSENNVNFASDPKAQNCFFSIQFNQPA